MLASQNQTILNRRYMLHESIGTGGNGIVYLATDVVESVQVALKLLKKQQLKVFTDGSTSQVDARLALAKEFRLLASLRHPNIISVIDYGFAEDGDPFFTMELLHEAPDILHAGRDTSPQRKLEMLLQLLQALVYLHRRGVLHRDLKPSNILVPLVDGEPVVKLLDFGLAQERTDKPTAEDMAVGTLFYMSPEVLSGGIYTEASDMYGVGLIAYELFAGRYPFMMQTITRMIDTLKTVMPDENTLPDNPALRAVIMRLLAKEPADRYQDAQEVIEAISAALNVPPPPESIAIRESFLQASEMVGRDFEMYRLGHALEMAAQGRGSVWMLGGESGVGKTRLADELRARALVSGALVLRGQSFEQGNRPFEVWRKILRRLALTTAISPQDAALVKLILPDIPLTVAPAPHLNALSQHELEQKVTDVLERLLEHQTASVVLILEDAQWMRSDSMRVFRLLHTQAVKLSLLVVMTYNAQDYPTLPQMISDANVLLLNRLTREEIARLSESMLGAAGRKDEVIDFIMRETEGNAFFLIEVVRALAEEAGDLQHVSHAMLPETLFTNGVNELLQRRLKRLPASGLELVKLAALIGRQIDPRLMTELSPGLDLESWLQMGADAAVFDVADGRWRFAHDKLRAAVLNNLPGEELRTLNHRVAVAMTANKGVNLYHARQIAQHWVDAGEYRVACEHLRESGERAMKTNHPGEAIQLFEQTLEIYRKAGVEDGDMAETQYQLAIAHHNLNDYQPAQDLLNESYRIFEAIQNPHGAAKTLHMLARIDFEMGRFDDAREQFETVLSRYRTLDDQKGLVQALISLGTLADSYDGSLEEARKYFDEALAVARAESYRWGIARALNNLASAVTAQAAYDEAETLYREALNIAREDNDTMGIMLALSNLGLVAQQRGRDQQAEALYRESLELARDVSWPLGEAQVYAWLGDIKCRQGSTEIGRLYLGRALRIANRADGYWIILNVLTTIGLVMARAGEASAAYTVLHYVSTHPSTGARLRQTTDRELALLDGAGSRVPQPNQAALSPQERQQWLTKITNIVADYGFTS